MTHRDAVAICQTYGVTSLDGLTIDGSQVLVLIVAQNGFLRSVWQCGNGDAAMLAAHIAVGSLDLNRCL